MGNYHWIRYWLCFAVGWSCVAAPRLAVGACDCTYGAFVRPGGNWFAYKVGDAFGCLVASGSGSGGTVACITAINSCGDTDGPWEIWYNPGTWTLWTTVTSAQIANCQTNDPTVVVITTNYVKCVSWTNNTGVSKAGFFTQLCDGAQMPGCEDNGEFGGLSPNTAFVFAGSIITRCFTNQCPCPISFFVSPFVGAPREEWIEVAINTNNNAFLTTNGNPGNVAAGAQFGQIGGNDGLAGALGLGGVAGTNVSPATNLVRVFNLAPTNGIPGSGATSQDIYNLGDALIRNGQVQTDRILNGLAGISNAVARGSTNGGNGDVVDAIHELNDDVNDGFNGVIGGLGTNGVLHRDLTNGFATLSNAAWGRGLSTNAFGDPTVAESQGGTAFSSNYGGATNSAGGQFGSAMSNGLSGSESGLLVDLASGTSYPGSDLAKLDFRPSQWMSSIAVAGVAIKAIVGAFCAALLYWIIWKDMEERLRSLNESSQNVGRALTGASLIGSTVGLSVKTAIASIVTVGLAGLPTAVSAFAGGGISSSFIETAQAAAGGSGAGTLGSKMGTVWQWFGLLVPFGVVITATLNFWAWRVFAFGFETLWHIIFRLVPVFLLLSASNAVVTSASSANWIIDNRLSQPVAILSGDPNGMQTQWFPPGVRKVDDLASTISVAYGLGVTNSVSASAQGNEWTRLIIAESSTNSWVAKYYAVPEVGFKWGFERGFILGCAGSLVCGVLWFSRRTARIAFGGQSE